SSGSQWTSWISRNSMNDGKVKHSLMISVNQTASIILATISFYRNKPGPTGVRGPQGPQGQRGETGHVGRSGPLG
ncbi:unnamed protein product, partial [Tetraodon nigroviridis]